MAACAPSSLAELSLPLRTGGYSRNVDTSLHAKAFDGTLVHGAPLLSSHRSLQVLRLA